MKKSEFYVFIGSLLVTVLAGYATMLVDAAVGGRYLGESAVSAVDLLLPVNEAFYAVALLLGAGANTVAALAFGRGDIPSVRKYFTAGVVSLCVAMALCLIVVLCLRDSIARVLSEGGTLYDNTLSYLSSIVVFSAINGVFLIVKLFTAMVGRPRLVMLSALSQLAVNVICDILFVRTFNLGIKGLAYSSILAVLVGFGILLHFCLRSDCPFRIIRLDGGEFLSALKTNARYGAGFIGADASYILFHFLMNAVVLRFTGESGLFCWSVAVIVYFVGYYAAAAANETCISLGGRYMGVSNNRAVRYIYIRSFVFVAVWIVSVLVFVFAFPDRVLPFFGAREQDTLLMKVLLCSVPFIFGTNLISLALIPQIQKGRIARFALLNAVLFLSVPLLFVAAHFVAPGDEWYGIACVALVHLTFWVSGRLKRQAHRGGLRGC